ncbi:MAG: glycosyltransferase family 2 protein [Pseudomonadota bacterium]|nr:glycosyltransferase family 2 protein [Pseudomonadota bacterium]
MHGKFAEDNAPRDESAAPSSASSVSVVVPVKDEAASIEPLVAGLRQVLAGRCRHFEIIFVDDGSTDGTWQKIGGLPQEGLDQVKAMRLRRNFGKATALATGFRECSGDIVFTMDGDLQDDPSEIPRFLEKLDEGYDLVSCWKENRQDPLSKTLPSKLFNRITAKLSGLKLHDFNCGFKVYRREVLEKIRLYGELHRYVPVLAHDLGYKVGEIAVTHHPRRHGKSKYGLERYARGLLDLITVLATTRYLQKPGHLFGGVGLASAAIGGLILAYLSVLWVFGQGPIGTRPLFSVGILLIILSIQLVSLGLVAELLTRHTEARTPDMIVAERIGGSLDD